MPLVRSKSGSTDAFRSTFGRQCFPSAVIPDSVRRGPRGLTRQLKNGDWLRAARSKQDTAEIKPQSIAFPSSIFDPLSSILNLVQ